MEKGGEEEETGRKREGKGEGREGREKGEGRMGGEWGACSKVWGA